MLEKSWAGKTPAPCLPGKRREAHWNLGARTSSSLHKDPSHTVLPVCSGRDGDPASHCHLPQPEDFFTDLSSGKTRSSATPQKRISGLTCVKQSWEFMTNRREKKAYATESVGVGFSEKTLPACLSRGHSAPVVSSYISKGCWEIVFLSFC